MQLEVGAVLSGKVTSITKFGAFIELPGGKTGMVHISEVASVFVREISDHLAEQQEVTVKVIGIDENGRISLSIKQLQENAPQRQRPRGDAPPQSSQRDGRDRDAARRAPRAPKPEKDSFEEMLSKFKQRSDEKMSDIKRGVESKRGFSKRGRH